jgi:uncharacterized SAM-binding protein YcdF (DUF218 family)
MPSIARWPPSNEFRFLPDSRFGYGGAKQTDVMTRVGSDMDRETENGPAPARVGILARLSRVFSRLVTACFAVALVALPIGFLYFAKQVAQSERQISESADGIVVLTGGSSRINDAMELLAAGKGRRLLITGVYPETRLAEIAHKVPKYQTSFACCVDLDRSALNTFGNALETRRWAVERQFKSLIVVTSNYHMPRAMAEIAHQLPDVRLIAYPVVSETIKAEPWWTSPSTARLLLSEYLKYIVALARMQIDPSPTVREAG